MSSDGLGVRHFISGESGRGKMGDKIDKNIDLTKQVQIREFGTVSSGKYCYPKRTRYFMIYCPIC
jgi:hypothetical protein